MPRPPYPYKTWAAYQQARGGDVRLGRRRYGPEPENADIFQMGIWSPGRTGTYLWVDRPDEVPEPVDRPELLDLARRGINPVNFVVEGPFPPDTVSQSVAAYRTLLNWDPATVMEPIRLDLLVNRSEWENLMAAHYPASVDSLTEVAGLALWEAWMRWVPARLRHDAPGAVFWARLAYQAPQFADEYWPLTPAGADGVPVEDAWGVMERNGFSRQKHGRIDFGPDPLSPWGSYRRRRR